MTGHTRNYLYLKVIIFFIAVHFTSSQQDTPCVGLSPKIYHGHMPREGSNAGKYIKIETDGTLLSCVYACCSEKTCNAVFMYNTTCFTVECTSDYSCQPDTNLDQEPAESAQLVIVRSVKNHLRYSDQDERDELIGAASDNDYVSGKTCVSSQTCGEFEICLKNSCECKEGYRRNTDKNCVSLDNATQLPASVIENTDFAVAQRKQVNDASSESPPRKVQNVIVNVVNKTVRLPYNEVTLVTFTVPPAGDPTRYNYQWTPLSQPAGSGETVSQTVGPSLTLKHLTEGLYTFKVTVTSSDGFGETTANVTVLPQQRENEIPVAIVTPPHQIVKLPNSRAVLDATSSKDDSGIAKYHWELQQGPLGYQPNLSDTQTLQLKDLRKPGNYTFRLTVTDTDGATDSTLANITVLQIPDYPPQANAGPPVLLYLPHNNITLNGNLSTDDKGIVSWEWTKSASDQDKAVDMQNTHTPYLQLSHLEEGMYTFVLKVTDDSGQSSSSDVYVFVKPPTNKPPNADAGPNVTIALPQTWIILNGSLSTDDIGIDHWMWEQLSGPRKSTLLSQNASATNVTNLTKGEYVFQLTVVDGNDNIATDKVSVIVTQNKNAPPKANAGGDKSLTLPLGVLVINGSSSSDDLGIAKWQWTREPTSLAIGNILEQTDESPILMVTDVVAGRYEFRLRVSDDQGEWNEDTVSIILKPDPELLNLVELTLNIEAGKLTQTQRDSVILKLGMLLRDASKIVVRDLKADSSGRSTLIFFVTSPTGSISGPQVVHSLKNKLAQDSFLLRLSVVDIRTSICQNNCSGHGVCDQETRICLCEAFWMQDLIRKYMGDGESNCGWSILYVIIGTLTLVFLAVSCIWGIICLCFRLCQSPVKENTRYALLESTEQIRLPMREVVLTDSDTDSDVLFENKSGKPNGMKNFRNGYKAERRVKT